MTIRISEICKCGNFFSEFENKDQIRQNVVRYLNQLRIPTRIKGRPNETEEAKKLSNERKRRCKMKKSNILAGAEKNENEGVFFGAPLDSLPTKTITLRTGHIMSVPKTLHEMCAIVLANAEVKGVFRKQGSGAKQEGIKNQIEKNGNLPEGDLDVIDVAVIIKYFLRLLPTPLIPVEYHEVFIACGDHADREDVLVLACLLLPDYHLNILTYMMQFFEQVASHSTKNHMNAYNIAVCVGPNIMPVYKQEYVMKVVGIMKILIEKSDLIGTVPMIMRENRRTRKMTFCQKIAEKLFFRRYY